jgi:hypothetical protein
MNTTSFVGSVSLSVRTAAYIFVKFDIADFHQNLSAVLALIKVGQNNRRCT